MIISVDNITKYFLDKLIFENVSFTIEDNSRIGLIGINGAGKTTLIRILMDELSADNGTVSKKSGAKIGYLKQNATLDNNNTIYSEMLGAFDGLVSIGNRLRALENEISNFSGNHNSSDFLKISAEYSKLQQQFENCDGYLINVKIKTILNGMGFSDKALDTVISTLSGGEKTRLALAKLLIEEPDLLILDEPTNHLDFKTLMWLENYLISYKGAILTVSHDRYFLDKTVNKIIEIDRARLYEYSGNYSVYQVLREQRLTRELKEYEAQEKQIAELSDYVQRNITRASTSNMAKSRQKMLDKIEPITKPIFSNKKS
ncbi:MAG: ABC-F family ATP-binding cassette domain-containing protein, partial [Oscillospiraceae bacterium]|nr:ABC-F family ATP-binding cassette domain-containing protein [Oscillospiraceae bacterium]